MDTRPKEFRLPAPNGKRVRKIPPGVGPRYPQVVVLVGATGDLARRKLMPGLFHLATAGFIPGCRIVGVSLEDMDADGFRAFAREALDEFSTRKISDADWTAFAESLDYVPLAAGAGALAAAVATAEQALGRESRRLHYLSVPPNAALSTVRLLGDAGLVEGSRIIMEKPFGTDLESAVSLNAQAARGLCGRANLPDRSLLGQGARAEYSRLPLCQRVVRTDLEPQLHRPRADRRSRDARTGRAPGFYEQTGAFRDMVVTHLFQIVAFMAMEPPTSLEPVRSARKKTKSFAA